LAGVAASGERRRGSCERRRSWWGSGAIGVWTPPASDWWKICRNTLGVKRHFRTLYTRKMAPERGLRATKDLLHDNWWKLPFSSGRKIGEQAIFTNWLKKGNPKGEKTTSHTISGQKELPFFQLTYQLGCRCDRQGEKVIQSSSEGMVWDF